MLYNRNLYTFPCNSILLQSVFLNMTEKYVYAKSAKKGLFYINIQGVSKKVLWS